MDVQRPRGKPRRRFMDVVRENMKVVGVRSMWKTWVTPEEKKKRRTDLKADKDEV